MQAQQALKRDASEVGGVWNVLCWAHHQGYARELLECGAFWLIGV